ncbi:MAG: dihydrodipicolinate synthase family protein [Firmicutes bacterium]|nr:dihydrodipicolinate synthase family protein [Bacillota bacterium]
MNTIPDGVYPTMVTPFTDDLRVDCAALPPLLRWYEARGAVGVFALCASSEIKHLTFEERLGILRTLMRAKKPGTVVLASGHVESGSAAFTREARAFAAEGADVCVFVTSLAAARDEGEDIFLRRLEAAAKALGDTPLGLYECPGPYKRQLPPETIRRLPEIGNFVFLKDTSCDLEKIKGKLAAARGTALKVYNANTATLLESLRAGCAGYCGVMGNYHPRLYAKLCEIYASDPALAERLQAFLDTGFGMRQLYPVCAKYHLQLEGVPMGLACRSRDAGEFTREQRKKIERLREMARQFEQESMRP